MQKFFIILISSLLCTGCVKNRGVGVGIRAGIGAAVGYAVGAKLENEVAGTVIGALAGGLVGALVTGPSERPEDSPYPSDYSRNNYNVSQNLHAPSPNGGGNVVETYDPETNTYRYSYDATYPNGRANGSYMQQENQWGDPATGNYGYYYHMERHDNNYYRW